MTARMKPWSLLPLLVVAGCSADDADAGAGGSGEGGSGAATQAQGGSSGTGGHGNGGGTFDAGPPVTVELTPIGAPTWTITDVNFVVCNGGLETTAYSEFDAVVGGTLAAHYLDMANYLWATSEPHDGPYDSEFAAGLAQLGLASVSRFRASSFETPSGMCMFMMIVPGPGAPSGASPAAEAGPLVDFGSGLTIDGTLFREQVEVDPIWDTLYVTPDGMDPPLPYAHWNHVPVLFLDNNDFSQHLPGSYQFELSLTGSSGDGYLLKTGYEVVAD